MKNVEDIYPLSPLQQGLLFHALLDPESPAYLNQTSLTLRHVEPESFRKAWEMVVARHAVLRTAFLWEGLKEPLQAVRQRVKLPWEEADWRGCAAGERGRRLDALRAAERSRPLALGRAPLMRFVLLRLEEEVYELVWTFHHLLLDGWSTPLLFGEVQAIYRALCDGRSPGLPPARPYRDYIAWLQRREEGAAEGFWRRYLEGFTAPTPLAEDRLGTTAALSSAEESAALSPAEAAGLQSFAARHRLTLNTLAQGAWALLLSRYSGSDDVVFGAVVAGRPADLPGVESVIGLFINTLPARVRIPAALDVATWLAKIQAQQIELRQHEHSPLSRIQAWSELPRGSALFDSLLVCENYPRDALAEPVDPARLRVAAVRSVELTGYALSAAVAGWDGVTIHLGYDPSRFDAVSVARRAQQFRRVLAALAAAPGCRVEDLPLLGEGECHQLLTEWSRKRGETARAEQPFETADGLFAAQAERTPDRLALVTEEGALTYAELARRSRQLACFLERLGVGPDRPVGIFVDRSPEMVVGLLGVLAAGGAYLPIDPAYPEERVAWMLANAGAAVLLTQERHRAALARSPARHICLDSGWPAVAQSADAPPARRAHPDQLAYIMYTSGSTGQPKGVQVTHRGLVNFLTAMAESPGIGPADSLLAVTTLSFDIAGLELYLPLISGAHVVLASREAAADGLALLDLLASSAATVLQATPATWRQLLAAEWNGSPGMRALCGGEALPRELAQQVLARSRSLWNLYGPTETTIWSAIQRVVADERGPAVVPIGRPIANTSLMLVDRNLLPVPLGAAGELLIGGDGLARGYRGLPDFTAEKFIPDLTGASPGARLYRTGDLARYLANGGLEFLGRIDHQVKVRGFRIELGEIEAALEAHPAVRQAVALARQDRPGQVHLVAYVVPAKGEPAAESPGAGEELRQHLRRRLPEHMVPASFVLLPCLPLTPNGKIDRRALPQPDWQARPAADVAPRDAVEETLAAIWREVLKRERVGVHDSFFELGGDSIQSIQILSRARKAGLELTARQIFAHPTIAGLAAVARSAPGAAPEGGPAAEAAAAAEEPLARLDAATLVAAAASPVEDVLPAAPVQQGMLYHTLRSPEAGVYVEQLSLSLRGDLDAGAFRAAWRQVVDRHAALRVSFVWKGVETPLQRVHRGVELPWTAEDWRGIPAAAKQSRLAAALAEDRRKGLDLERAPLMRFALVRTEEDSYRFVWTFHHVLLDGWSMPILLREVFTLYEAGRRGVPAQLEPAPRYRDYIAWLVRQDTAAAEDFWRRYLAGFGAPTPLPFGRPAAPGGPAASGTREHRLPSALTTALRALAGRRRLTLNTLVQGAWAFVLAQSSGAEDVVFGAVTAGRSAPVAGIEEMVGLFINTLPVRARVSPARDWLAWMGGIQEEQLELRRYEHSPLSQVQRWSEVPPGVPLFETVLAFENYPVDAAMQRQAGESLGIVAGELREQTAYALTLAVSAEAHLDLRMLYDAARFDAPAILRLQGQLAAVLTSMTAHPAGEPHAALSLLTIGECHQVLVEWNAPAPCPSTRCLHEGFAAQAAARPDAVAVVCEDQRLSYGGLDAQANRWARRLRALGVGAEVPVALCLERSLDLVVAVVAIVKAGGAYVPLDPLYPRERLAAALADAKPRVVITQESLRGSLPDSGAPILCLDAPQPPELRAELAAPEVHPDNLAYVIFTSGSTGRPKGSLITHRNAARLFAAADERLGCGRRAAADVWTLFHSSAFDFSVWEMWGALLHGGRLVVVPYWISRTPADFLALLSREGVTVLNQTPSAFRQLIAQEEQEDAPLPCLHTVILGGEAVELAVLAPWLARHGDRRPRLVNMYGITETTVHVTSRPLRSEDLRDGGRSPIGSPLPDLQIRILGRDHHPVPVGVAGEMFVAGDGLGRGYLGRPALTAERFVPDPFADGASAGSAGGRLYRTGDLARYTADGGIDYLGRIDHQVKVRGHRIELGEIEAALLRHPGVRDAAVLLREENGDRSLAAYVVPRSEGETDAAELRDWLQRTLPEPMIPAVFLLLAALPLTEHGKLDRRRLAALRPQAPAEPAAFRGGPRGAIEEVLAGLLAELLHRDAIDVEASFFALGGHSLLATQLSSRASQRLGIELSLRTVLEAPTIRALAEHAALALRDGRPVQRPPLTRAPRDQPLPLSFAQERLLLWHRKEPRSSTRNLPTAVRLHGPLRPELLALSLSEVVRRHEALRTGFAAEGEPAQEIAPAQPVALPRIDLAGLPEAARWREVRRLRSCEAGRPFDLARPPLLRGAVLRLAEQDHAVLLTTHEIAFDGLSMGVLARELAALYASFLASRPSALPELAVQYADFAAWQRHWLTGQLLADELSYWRRHLGASPEPLRLATDGRSASAVAAPAGGRRRFHVGNELLLRLQALNRQHGVTLFMTLLAAWASLLARTTDQEEVSVGTPTAGRIDPQLEPLIGRFANTLVLRTRLTGDPSLSSLLGRVRGAALGAYAHQGLPFERLLAEYDPGLDPLRLFRLWFSLTPAGGGLELPGLRVGRLPAEEGVATIFDLSLVVVDEGDRLGGWLVYRADRLDRLTIERLGSQLEHLLHAMAAAPGRPVSELPLLSPAERHRLLMEGGGSGAFNGRWKQLVAVPDEIIECIVDRDLQPVARGRSGELCLRGGGLVPSIDGRADLTAEMLVPDPNGAEPGARMGRTGEFVELTT